MSTIKEIIARVDAIKPNAFDDATKVNWLASLEGKIAADVFLMSFPELAQFRYTVADSMDTEPLVSFPHDDVYDLWLCAQIDLANGEYNKYQNTMVSYNESYGNFVRWFARVYEPSQRNGHPGFCLRSDLPVYYITAYGLAVKQGFMGSLDEWLESLKGAAVSIRYENGVIQWQNEGDAEWKDLISATDFQIDSMKGVYLPVAGGNMTGPLQIMRLYFVEGETYGTELPDDIEEGRVFCIPMEMENE